MDFLRANSKVVQAVPGAEQDLIGAAGRAWSSSVVVTPGRTASVRPIVTVQPR